MVSSHTRDRDAAAAPPQGRYRIDPARSQVSFRTRHLFGLAAVAGTMAIRSGEVVIGDPGAMSTVIVVLDAGSFHTSNFRRDTDVCSPRFLHVEDHPTITFTASGLRPDGDTWSLPGELTVRGTDSPVELHVTELRVTEGALHARASVRVDRYALGVTAAKGMAVRHLDINMTITGPR